MMVSADDRAVDAVCKRIDVLCKDPRLQCKVSNIAEANRTCVELTPVVIASYVVFVEQPSG